MKYYIILACVLAAVTAQSHQQYTTPVPILKQINKHNEDGSYSYGYEGADGTFKIETKYPNGEVFGKYGYVDDTGKLREIEYGATKRGFEPQGNDINVAPPTIHNNQQVRPLGPNEEDDGQYREDPSIYYKEDNGEAQPQSQYRNTYTPKYTQTQYQPQHQQQYQPQYQQPRYQQQPQYRPQYQEPQYQQQSYRPTTKFNFDDFLSNRPEPAPQQPRYNYNPQPTYNQNNYRSQFGGHPATNVDLNLGSYTVNYR